MSANISLLGLPARIPPSNAQAEQALLGCLLSNNKACRHVEGFLRPKHFIDPAHGRIFEAVLQSWRAGRLVDIISLRGVFEHTAVLDEVGGTAYLAQLVTAQHGIVDVGNYGRAIYDAWMCRELIDIGEEIVNRAFGAEPEMDAAAQWDAATHRLSMLPEGREEPDVGGVQVADQRDSTNSNTVNIVGLGEPDEYDELPKHVVALSSGEIETLYSQHAYAAQRYRPRKRVKQSDGDARSYSYYTARAAMFERMLPRDEPEDDTPGQDSPT